LSFTSSTPSSGVWHRPACACDPVISGKSTRRRTLRSCCLERPPSLASIQTCFTAACERLLVHGCAVARSTWALHLGVVSGAWVGTSAEMPPCPQQLDRQGVNIGHDELELHCPFPAHTVMLTHCTRIVLPSAFRFFFRRNLCAVKEQSLSSTHDTILRAVVLHAGGVGRPLQPALLRPCAAHTCLRSSPGQC